MGERKAWWISRHAAICQKCEPIPTRVFFPQAELAKAWRCPLHGVGQVQKNRPYRPPR